MPARDGLGGTCDVVSTWIFIPWMRACYPSFGCARVSTSRRMPPRAEAAAGSGGAASGPTTRKRAKMTRPPRIFVISDVHCDYPDNEKELERTVSATEFRGDYLLLAGDVSDNIDIVRRTLVFFKTRFAVTFFCVGNHELWIKPKASVALPGAPPPRFEDSLAKLAGLRALCDELGVHTRPTRLDGVNGGSPVWVFPTLSWYHASFDTEPSIPGFPPVESRMTDFRLCAWPPPLDPVTESVAARLDAMNEPAWAVAAAEAQVELIHGVPQVELTHGVPQVERAAVPIISFSHFLPRLELIPEKRYLFYPELPKAVGSRFLGARIASLLPDCHAFGHTHFGWDSTIEGIRYMQAPLGYPSERQVRMPSLVVSGPPGNKDNKPAMVYDTGGGNPRGMPGPKLRASWSHHYETTARTPENLELAPWVAALYKDRPTSQGAAPKEAPYLGTRL